MTKLDVDDPIVDWAVEEPGAIAVFERYGIDYCCGGKSLGYACRQAGRDPHQVIAEIRKNSTA